MCIDIYTQTMKLPSPQRGIRKWDPTMRSLKSRLEVAQLLFGSPSSDPPLGGRRQKSLIGNNNYNKQ